MRVIMLGTGAAMPDPDRHHSSILITVRDRHYLFDCGQTGGTGNGSGAGVAPTRDTAPGSSPGISGTAPAEPAKPKRFHGTVSLDPNRVGRDAGRIADEVIAHLVGLVGSKVQVILEIEAEIPGGASENVVRMVTENGRTLKFTNQGFEQE